MYDELKQQFGYMGIVDNKKVGARDIYRILQEARSREDFQVGLQTINMYYNYGVKLRHREISSRLLAAAMTCQQEAEAVEVIKLYGTFLEHPPDRALVYATMGHFLDAGQPLVVREIAKAVREDWRMAVESPLYGYAVEAMLSLPEDALGEAREVHADAGSMGVRLPAQLHTRLLELCLEASDVAAASQDSGAGAEGGQPEDEAEPSASADEPEAVEPAEAAADVVSDAVLEHLRMALQVADALAHDGHLRGGASAATLCSVSWLFWRLASVPEPVRASLLAGAEAQGACAFLGGSWSRTLEAALDSFGCHWGFSARLPRGLFRALEASPSPEAARLVEASQARFGRFYPREEGS